MNLPTCLIEYEGRYGETTRLEWWGTLVGNAGNEKVMIAGQNKADVLKAARQICPDARPELIQAINITKRKHITFPEKK